MKSTRKLSLLISSIIILCIITLPYLLYSYKSINPDLTEYKTIFGTIKGGVYIQVQSYVYFFLSKLIPLLLLVIWFFTNKHWWVHALIIPISVYLFQLISVINDSEQYVDEVDFIYSVPIAVIVFIILYFLRSKMAIYITAVDLKKEMDENMKTPKKIG